jgi:hypothetical protein
MSNLDLSQPFDALKQAVSQAMDITNEAGSIAFEAGDHERVAFLQERIQALKAFEEKIAALRMEWTVLSTDMEQNILEDAGEDLAELLPDINEFDRLKPTFPTSEKELRMVMLQALVSLSGVAPEERVLDRVERYMRKSLKRIDYEPVPGNPNLPHWKEAAKSAIVFLEEKDMAERVSDSNKWRITDKGRSMLKRQPWKQVE